MKKSEKIIGFGMSGGPDSTYLFDKFKDALRRKAVLLHLNHNSRGADSDRDQEFLEKFAKNTGAPLVSRKLTKTGSAPLEYPGFEARARQARRRFFEKARNDMNIHKILVAHTADDQVETVLMRIFEGAGVSGLKGIPRRTDDGIERPLLETWREDILEYLRRNKIPYRTDKSNFDTRFERNWIRHVLIPLLEKRYGKAVKKRIFTLGERFREIDEFLGAAARRWMKRNVNVLPGSAGESFLLPRKRYAKLPSVVRKKIVQILCFERMKIAPNERLLESMDGLIVSGKPSARLGIGNGGSLSCRYGDAVFRPRGADRASREHGGLSGKLVVIEMDGKPTPSRLRSLAAGEGKAVFDAEAISGPFFVRPLRAGDRIHPFGAAGTKKVKEILVDRKIPRDERWGRPVVCDAGGTIVWIPGIVRSSAAPVTRRTRRAAILELSRCPPDRGMFPSPAYAKISHGTAVRDAHHYK